MRLGHVRKTETNRYNKEVSNQDRTPDIQKMGRKKIYLKDEGRRGKMNYEQKKK